MIANLGFGGSYITNLKSLNEALRLLDVAFDSGITHFDTAPLYGQGYSEVIFGNFSRRKRNEITLTTKFGLGEHHDTERIPVNLLLPFKYYVRNNKLLKSIKDKIKPPIQGEPTASSGLPKRTIDRSSIERSLIKSLKRLQTDYVDYYLLHEGLPSFLTEDAMSYLFDLKKAGTVRNIGIGTEIQFMKGLSDADVKGWDTLQYNVDSPAATNDLLTRHSTQIHFHHSCLQNFNQKIASDINLDEKGGFLLAAAAKRNPKGKILFSTRSQSTLKKNVTGFLKYYSPGTT